MQFQFLSPISIAEAPFHLAAIISGFFLFVIVIFREQQYKICNEFILRQRWLIDLQALPFLLWAFSAQPKICFPKSSRPLRQQRPQLWVATPGWVVGWSPWGFSTRFLTVGAIESTFWKVMTVAAVDGILKRLPKTKLLSQALHNEDLGNSMNLNQDLQDCGQYECESVLLKTLICC